MGGRFRLIGIEGYGAEFIDKDGKQTFAESSSSINLLTNKAIFRRKAGDPAFEWKNEKSFTPSWLPFKIGKVSKQAERETHFKTNKAWYLEDFEPIAFSEWQWAIPNLCGFIDESFVFKQCSRS